MPPIVRTIATTGDGVDKLGTAISELEQWMGKENRLAERRARHWLRRIDAMLRAELMRRARRHGLSENQLSNHAAQVANGNEDPWQLVAQLTNDLFKEEN
jgi:LAO/AO transport system kinase